MKSFQRAQNGKAGKKSYITVKEWIGHYLSQVIKVITTDRPCCMANICNYNGTFPLQFSSENCITPL